MSRDDRSIAPWTATDLVVIPSSESSPKGMLEYAKPQLSTRELKAIASAFESESYEMVATFVWTKAAAVLKKQLAMLGMEFVGEMLRRPDLNEDSDPATSIADHEAIALAEDLAIITSTQGMRLKHGLELVAHFANLEQKEAEEEMMQREEALGLLKTCITSILGKPRFEAAVQFAEFRQALGERPLKEDDGDVQAVLGSPYFFVRTTLSVLLTLAKGTKGATKEHAIGNTTLLVPLMWPKLREPEKWQVGQAYAEVSAAGNRHASSALKKALLEVQGFDFVPETLRSSTFTEAAARVLTAHFAFNNFHNEDEPMSVLANLGTAIPKPAFAKCMEATLAIGLGNKYGHTWAAVTDVKKVLDSLRPEQWEYYFNECFPRDRTILDKLSAGQKPMIRWMKFASEYGFEKLKLRSRLVREFIALAQENKSVLKAQEQAALLRSVVTK